MDKEKREVKEKLRNINSVSEFEDLLNSAMISGEEKQIITLIYKEKKTMSYIADVLGMSESVVKRRHSKILIKLGKLFT